MDNQYIYKRMLGAKGFTLVELSIALVIIGLLIGGILVGQSLIGAARIQSVIRQYQQYDVAVDSFKSKYKQLPGDTRLFIHNGNNDGIIGNGGGAHETANFWPDLSIGMGLKNSLGTNYQSYTYAVTPVTEVNCPKFDIPQDTTTQPCMLPQNYDFQNNWPTINFGGAKNFYNYAQTGPGNIIGAPGPVASPIYCLDALAIDTKTDDGRPYYGGVLGPGCATYNVNDTVYTVTSGTNTTLIVFFGAANSTTR